MEEEANGEMEKAPNQDDPNVNGDKEENDKEENDKEKANEEGDEEDDPVVHEIPVFLAKRLQDQLYLFQVRFNLVSKS